MKSTSNTALLSALSISDLRPSTMSQPKPQTYTYKTFVNTDGSTTPIPVDVYLPESTSGAPLTPLIWVHTGGFLQGTRKFVPPHLLRALSRHGLALVAPDFRLCPQVSIREVLEDVTDCIIWTLDPASRAASGCDSARISSERYILGGSSAGGWPALLLGLSLHEQASRIPRPPAAVFAIYAITTVTPELAPFFHEPLRPLPWAADGKLIEESPLKAEGHLTKCLDASHGVVKASGARVRTDAPPAANPVRAALYNFARQEGSYASLILQSPEEAKEVCTPSLIESKVKAPGPPVLIAYGDSDPKVPHSQSLHVVQALERAGYTQPGSLRVIAVEGADHLFDMEPHVEVEDMWEWISQFL